MTYELLPTLIRNETSLVEELSLIDRNVFGATFCWVSAAVANCNASKVDSVHVSLLVGIQDGSSQRRNVNACVALASDVEVILFKAGELDEK